MARTALDALTDLLDLRAGGSGGGRFGVLRSRGSDRFLLPLDHPAATAGACRSYQGLRPPTVRVRRRLAAEVVARRGDRAFAQVLHAPRSPGSLLHHLEAELGLDQLQVAAGLGTVDEVWKPTLQVFDPSGSPVAFVKVGLGPVAAHLVRREAEALAAWSAAEDPRLVVPGLLGTSTWRGIPLVAVAPLPADARRLPSGTASAWGVRTLDPPLPDAAPEAAPWWRDRLHAPGLPADTAALLGAATERAGAARRGWARWHGDWVPWNLARCSRGLIAWDWEYSEAGAPVGLDEVHAAYQVARVLRGRSVAEALAAAREAAPDPWLAEAHLVMLATRFDELAGLTGAPHADRAALHAAAVAGPHR